MNNNNSITDILGIICDYAQQGNYGKVASLIKEYNVDIHGISSKGTLLAAVCQCENTTVAKHILNLLTDDVDQIEKIDQLHSNMLKAIVNSKGNFKVTNLFGENIFTSNESVNAKLPNINNLAVPYHKKTSNIGKVSALYYTIVRENYALFLELLKRGANIEQPQGHLEITPLMLACCRGSLPFVKKLLEVNVDINKEDKLGNNPITFAIKYGHFTTAKLLIEHPQFYAKKTLNGENLISLIFKQDDFTDHQKTFLIASLLKKGVVIFKKDNTSFIENKLQKKITYLNNTIINNNYKLLKYSKNNNLDNLLNFLEDFNINRIKPTLSYIRKNYFQICYEIATNKVKNNHNLQKLFLLWTNFLGHDSVELILQTLDYINKNKEKILAIKKLPNEIINFISYFNNGKNIAEQEILDQHISKIYPYLIKYDILNPLKEIIDASLHKITAIKYKKQFIELSSYIQCNPQLSLELATNGLNSFSSLYNIIKKPLATESILAKHFEMIYKELAHKPNMKNFINYMIEVQQYSELKYLKHIIADQQIASNLNKKIYMYKKLYSLITKTLETTKHIVTAINNNNLLLLRDCLKSITPMQNIDGNSTTVLEYAAKKGNYNIIITILNSLPTIDNINANLLDLKKFNRLINNNNNISNENKKAVLKYLQQKFKNRLVINDLNQINYKQPTPQKALELPQGKNMFNNIISYSVNGILNRMLERYIDYIAADAVNYCLFNGRYKRG